MSGPYPQATIKGVTTINRQFIVSYILLGPQEIYVVYIQYLSLKEEEREVKA